MLTSAATVAQVLQDFEVPPTIAPRPPTTVANPHIDRSLGSKETHIQSHNPTWYLPSASVRQNPVYKAFMLQLVSQLPNQGFASDIPLRSLSNDTSLDTFDNLYSPIAMVV